MIWFLSVSPKSSLTSSKLIDCFSLLSRLYFNFQIFSCALMIVATYLMFRQRNEWALAMIAGAVFLLYAAITIPRELEKENISES